MGPSTTRKIGISTITSRMKGKLLAFRERGTYNPATGNERANRLASHSVPRSMRDLPRERQGILLLNPECNDGCGGMQPKDSAAVRFSGNN
jgi:hypothetical protein